MQADKRVEWCIIMTDAGNEQHLALLLRSFNRNMYLSYVDRTERVINKCIGDENYSTVDRVRTPDGAGDIAFRVKFDYPIYITLSHPICRFRSHRNYPVRERLFIANLGLVPVFFSSLNEMTVLKLWGDRATEFFNPQNSPLADAEIKCWKLEESSAPADFSSMNFLRQNGSQPEEAGKRLTEIYEKYFRLSYWSFPRRGFSPSTHFLHGRAHISSQVKVAKSLYVIHEIDKKSQRFEMEGKTVEAVQVRLGGLAEKDGGYNFHTFPAYVDTENANKMLARQNIGASFVNGIVSEILRKGKPRLSIMTVVAEYGESSFDILASLIGIIADRRYADSEDIAEIGTVDELREGVYDLYLDISKNMNVDRTLSDTVPNSFDIALDAMFPILVVTDERKVKMIHPLTWGFLKKWSLVGKDDGEQKEILNNLLSVMDLQKTSRRSKIFLSESAEYFSSRGINKHQFIRAVMRLVKDIRTCKMMRQTLATSDEKPAFDLDRFKAQE